MAQSAQSKIVLNGARDIPFSKLVLSQRNVRRIKNGQTIEQLAQDIANRGLIQERRVESPIPRSSATSRRERPLVSANRTASARNSGVKRFFGSGIGNLLPHGKSSPLLRRKSSDTDSGR